MGKIAFVFSGQGDQHTGMGKELYDNYPAAKAVFDMCDALRPGTSEQCFCGSEEELKETKNTQPCLFAMELAGAAVLQEKGIRPDAVAGFSLGEVTACAVADAVSSEDAFHLVCKRGELMQQAAERHDTSMAAVVKLTNAQVEELCCRYDHVYPVNFNYPGQITVAGLSSEMKNFAADVKAEGGRVLPLKVKGAFHSPFMAEAAEAFRGELAKVVFETPAVVLYSDVTAAPYGSNVAEVLGEQICSPVRWEEIICNMIAAGIDTFIEVGPGKTLINMIKKINGDVKTYCLSELPQILSEVRP